MDSSLEELYFEWLLDKIRPTGRSRKRHTFDRLYQILHSTEFVWFVQGDQNRAAEGQYLRNYFRDETGTVVDKAWMALPCSLLEMFVALAMRANFQTNESVSHWFWEFMDNLGLSHFYYGSEMTEDDVNGIIETFIWRNYSPTGHRGGLFPLKEKIPNDQRKAELWYQLNYYLIDQDRP